MKVWIVEEGIYDSRSIVGVYATRESALAAHPPPREGLLMRAPERTLERPGGWQPDNPQKPETCEWRNGLDYGDAMTMWSEEVHE